MNNKDRWDSGEPRRQQTPFCDIQIKVVINCWHISVPYRSPTTQNVSDLDFDLSRSFKVKSNGATKLPVYDDFLFIFNSNIWPN